MCFRTLLKLMATLSVMTEIIESIEVQLLYNLFSEPSSLFQKYFQVLSDPAQMKILATDTHHKKNIIEKNVNFIIAKKRQLHCNRAFDVIIV